MDSPRLVPVVRLCAAGLIAAAGLAGCGDGAEREREFAQAQTYEPIGRRFRWNAPPAERHRISSQDFAMGGAMGGAEGPADDSQGGASLHWTTPAGWTERPPAPFRDANFAVAGDERAECYLTTLSGEAGGMEANINRWRNQVSLPPLGAAEIAALPRVPWFGGEAVAVDFAGQWTGMAGDQAEEGWRLVGLLQVTPMQSRFLKLVGPAEVVEQQLPAFRALADSFHDDADGAHAHGEPPAAAPAPSGAPSAASAPTSAADVQRNASLSWRTPAGWTRGPEKPMREVTYFAGEGQAVECYVTLLGGSAGGALANINRWCEQMGAPELTAGDLDRLERVPMAGAEGLLVSLERGPSATAAAGQELLLGAVCSLPERTLFVKLTGPRAAVEAQAPALVEFCRSLQAVP